MNKRFAVLVAILCGVLAYTTANAKGKGKKGKSLDEVESYLKKHDANHNNLIERSECSSSDATFNRADANHDGKLSRGELAEMLHAPEPKKK